MNKNSGYVGWSMSRRAVAAYENGEAPLSRIGSSKFIKAAAAIIGRSIWHHTSKHCNRTDFYKVAAVKNVADRLKVATKRLGSLDMAIAEFEDFRWARRSRSSFGRAISPTMESFSFNTEQARKYEDLAQLPGNYPERVSQLLELAAQARDKAKSRVRQRIEELKGCAVKSDALVQVSL
jgi:hypothetical protein